MRNFEREQQVLRLHVLERRGAKLFFTSCRHDLSEVGGDSREESWTCVRVGVKVVERCACAWRCVLVMNIAWFVVAAAAAVCDGTLWSLV